MDGEARDAPADLRYPGSSHRLLDGQPKEGPDFSQEARHLYICSLLQFTKLGRKLGGNSYSPDKNRRDAVIAAPHLDDADKGTYMCWSATASQRARARSPHYDIAREAISEIKRSCGAIPAWRSLMASNTSIPSLAFRAEPLQRALLSDHAPTSAAALALAPLERGTSKELQHALLSSDATVRTAAVDVAPLAPVLF
ncbi:hypothetical protein T492DRAFT_853475 [Pavlovales sp. CCMP2436]|nr:hypothetical protein T492DRAFT_853475 [Pavlovales sp. CCMP2436]